MEPMNIIFPLRGEEVLLAKKTRKIGVGLWNGYGGKIEGIDTPEQSSVKELRKESGLNTKAEDYQRVSIIDFYVPKSEKLIKLNRCFIFFIKKFTGEPKTTKEMEEPTWYKFKKIPYRNMIIGTDFWMPQVIQRKVIHGEVWYEKADRKRILSFHATQIPPAELYSERWNKL